MQGTRLRSSASRIKRATSKLLDGVFSIRLAASAWLHDDHASSARWTRHPLPADHGLPPVFLQPPSTLFAAKSGDTVAMFIAHLPAGYLLGRKLVRHHPATRTGSASAPLALLAAVLIGSVFPDVDLLYFYLIDGRRHHHHSYWTHLPIFWLLLTPPLWLLARSPQRQAMVLLFVAGVLLHLILDSITGSIAWRCPVDCTGLHLVTVTARYQPWWLNFILHWTFILELLIILLAGITLLLDRRRSRSAGDARRSRYTDSHAYTTCQHAARSPEAPGAPPEEGRPNNQE